MFQKNKLKSKQDQRSRSASRISAPDLRNGFTIIELLVSITIAVILFGAVTAIYNIGQNIYYRTDAKAEITQNGRVILDRLIREVRQTPNIITTLPPTTDDPPNLPSEIMFEDGHNATQIQYIRYYLTGTDIYRQIIVYYFDSAPDDYVYWHTTDQQGDPPLMLTLEDKLIGEYVVDIEFWGDSLININVYLNKGTQSEIINTSVYGRNS